MPKLSGVITYALIVVEFVFYPPTLRSRDIGVWKLVFPSVFPHFLSLDFFPSYSSLPIFLFSSSCYGVGPGGGWDQRNTPTPPTPCVDPPRAPPPLSVWLRLGLRCFVWLCLCCLRRASE